MNKRIVFRVKWKNGLWEITRSDVKGSTTCHTKQPAIDGAKITARALWKKGQLTQLVVHGKNGRIQYEYTYGKDPKRRKG